MKCLSVCSLVYTPRVLSWAPLILPLIFATLLAIQFTPLFQGTEEKLGGCTFRLSPSPHTLKKVPPHSKRFWVRIHLRSLQQLGAALTGLRSRRKMQKQECVECQRMINTIKEKEVLRSHPTEQELPPFCSRHRFSKYTRHRNIQYVPGLTIIAFANLLQQYC